MGLDYPSKIKWLNPSLLPPPPGPAALTYIGKGEQAGPRSRGGPAAGASGAGGRLVSSCTVSVPPDCGLWCTTPALPRARPGAGRAPGSRRLAGGAGRLEAGRWRGGGGRRGQGTATGVRRESMIWVPMSTA